MRSVAVVRWDCTPDEILSHAPRIDQEAARALGKSVYDVCGEVGRPFHELAVATLAGELVGFVLGYAAGAEYHIIDLVTFPAARRRGVGRALVEAAVQRAHERQAEILLLEVRRDNRPALRLYRSAELSAVRVRRAYYPDGGDAVELVREIEAGRLAAFDRIQLDDDDD